MEEKLSDIAQAQKRGDYLQAEKLLLAYQDDSPLENQPTSNQIVFYHLALQQAQLQGDQALQWDCSACLLQLDYRQIEALRNFWQLLQNVEIADQIMVLSQIYNKKEKVVFLLDFLYNEIGSKVALYYRHWLLEHCDEQILGDLQRDYLINCNFAAFQQQNIIELKLDYMAMQILFLPQESPLAKEFFCQMQKYHSGENAESLQNIKKMLGQENEDKAQNQKE